MTSSLALPNVVATSNTEKSSSISFDIARVIWSIVKVAGSVWNSGNIINGLADLHLIVLEDASLLASVSLRPFVNTQLTFARNDDDENRFGKFLNANWDIFPSAVLLFNLHHALIVGDAVVCVDFGWLGELEAWLLLAA